MAATQTTVELVAPGQVLAGKYRVERVLGAGGMGVVVAATHLELDQLVALKFLLPQFLENAEAVQRFTREARAAVRIRSENVAHILDVGRLEDGAPYIVMEFLEGQDLATRVEQLGPLAVEEAVDAVIQACDAIGEAHLLGIVHRDLKPANLFLTRRADGTPLVKVLDFGISKVTTGLEQSQLTRTSGLIGSPYYMSPEQLTTPKDVDARTDIWSLGIILYELLSGAPPFDAEAMGQLVLTIMSEPVEPISPTRQDVPLGLDGVIATALAKNRVDRFQRIEEFAQALIPFSSFTSERTSRAPRAVARSSAPPPTRREGVAVASSAPPPPSAIAFPRGPSLPTLVGPLPLDSPLALQGSDAPSAPPPAPVFGQAAAKPSSGTADRDGASSTWRWLALVGLVLGVGVVIGVLLLGQPSELNSAAASASLGVAPDPPAAATSADIGVAPGALVSADAPSGRTAPSSSAAPIGASTPQLTPVGVGAGASAGRSEPATSTPTPSAAVAHPVPISLPARAPASPRPPASAASLPPENRLTIELK